MTSPNSPKSPRSIKRDAILKKLKKNQFMDRSSLLDPSSQSSLLLQSKLEGFFNLFFIALCFFFVSSQLRHIMLEGTLIGLNAAIRIFNRIDIFPAWFGLLGASYLAVLFMKLLNNGWISHSFAPYAHHSLQLLVFGCASIVVLERKWPFVQTGFYLLEMMIIVMKMHSYISVNRELDFQYRKDKKEEPESKHEENKLVYPNNLTIMNFSFFLLVPTLVYELNYPRTPRIRWRYFFEKLSTFAVLWSFLHVLAVNYLEPILVQSATNSPFEAIVDLIIPALVIHILIFYIVWDVGANAFAELTRFADREFYSDWWNSTTFDEYARKWNKPVHEWLLRHVYLYSLINFKISPARATFITFLFSSVIHEFFLSALFGVFRPYIMFLQMLQLPLIYFGRSFKGTRFGNFWFWFSLILGIPLLSVLYSREYFLKLQLENDL